ncbi:MAG: hypothetical protein A2Y60_04115 [Chloroflexi bacterium RBG_13_54_9]|nr:MAG: hypothetical protein A2Y60_04115 [Chloroflexi bacterium RBG_13_54_9]
MRKSAILRKNWSLVLVLVFFLCCVPASADEQHPPLDVPLLPVDASGSIQLAACTLVVTLSCDDVGCAQKVQQTYQFHNTDRARATALLIGLPEKVDAQLVTIPDPMLTDVQGQIIESSSIAAGYQAIWQLNLDPNEYRTLTLSYVHPPTPQHLVRWRWEMSLLSAWGTLEGARVEFKLPQNLTDDAFLQTEPYPFRFDGTTFTWEYENLDTPLPHSLILIAPNTWQRLRELEASGDHYDLALLYLDIHKNAQNEGIPFPGSFDRIAAELEASLQVDPTNLNAQLELAQVYRARAEATSDLQLNYLLLAAQELAQIQAQRPEDVQVAALLSRTYYDAATIASETGDPAGALAYLKKAGEVPGIEPELDPQTERDLMLRWALSLAEQGMASQALAELRDVLSSEMEDSLLRYAPPVTSVQTEVELGPEERVARYTFSPYLPLFEETWIRLSDLAIQLNSVEGCQAVVQMGPDSPILEIRIPYKTKSELAQRSSDLVAALDTNMDMLSAFITAPWQTELLAYTAEHKFLHDRYVYEEQIDLTPLEIIWEEQSQYSRWRLIELQSALAQNEEDQSEQRLALLTQREQRQIWDSLPAASYWIFRVNYGDALQVPPGLSWLVGWGQARQLQIVYPVYHWPVIIPLSLVGVLMLFATFRLLIRR